MIRRPWSSGLLPRMAVAGLLVVAGLLGAVAPAQAATQTVTLSAQGPSPTPITIAKGDAVRFVNSDSVTHTITSNAGAWTFKVALAAGKTATTPTFGAAGTYGYRDDYLLVAIQQNRNGFITVKSAAPSPSPSAKPSATPRASSPPKATPAPAGTSTPSPTPSPSTSGVGTAIGPGLGVGGFPVLTPGQSSGPQPNVAPPPVGETATPAAAPGSPTYADKSGVVQRSAHGYGLPALLALVGIAGIASLLVRLLLAHPAAFRRTGSVGDPGKGEA